MERIRSIENDRIKKDGSSFVRQSLLTDRGKKDSYNPKKIEVKKVSPKRPKKNT